MNIKKYKQSDIPGLLRHNKRYEGDGVNHSNTDIDPSRTKDNYYLLEGGLEEINYRLSKVFYANKSDRVIMAEGVVTLPKEVKPEDEQKFFIGAYSFFKEVFGEENMINAVVHKDETTPHIHIDFMPVITEDLEYVKETKYLNNYKKEFQNFLIKTNNLDGETVDILDARKLLTRMFMTQCHQDLSVYMDNVLGYPSGVLNGATINGNKTVTQLKVQRLEQQIHVLENKKALLDFDIKNMSAIMESLHLSPADVGFIPLMLKITELEKSLAVYKNAVEAAAVEINPADIKNLKATREQFDEMFAQYAHVNIKDGRMLTSERELEALNYKWVTVIMLYNKNERNYPQREFVEMPENTALKANVTRFLNDESNELCKLVPSGGASGPAFSPRRTALTQKNYYALLKMDNPQEAILALYSMLEQLRINNEIRWDNRKILIQSADTSFIVDDEQKINNSIYFTNMIRQVMETSPYDTLLFTGKGENISGDSRALETRADKDRF